MLHLSLLNSILNNLFIVQKNIKCSDASNCMAVQFHILFIIKNRQLYLLSCLTSAIFGGRI